MAALVPPDRLYAPRNFLGWLMFSVAAGNVNGIAFLGAERFVTHLSGAGTQLGLQVGQWEVAIESILILVAFIGGATLAAVMMDGPRHRDRRPLYLAPLVMVAGLLAIGGLLGGWGWFGSFGGGLEAPNFPLLYLLSFAMGIQNSAVSINTGLAVRTTHLTGPATDLGIQITGALFGRGDVAQAARRGAWLRAGQVFAFIGGAALSVPLCDQTQFRALLAPALLVLLATALTFWPATRRAV